MLRPIVPTTPPGLRPRRARSFALSGACLAGAARARRRARGADRRAAADQWYEVSARKAWPLLAAPGESRGASRMKGGRRNVREGSAQGYTPRRERTLARRPAGLSARASITSMGNASQKDDVDVEPEADRQHQTSVSPNGQAPGLEAVAVVRESVGFVPKEHSSRRRFGLRTLTLLACCGSGRN